MDQTRFASYLFQGLGRPYLYLQQHDSAPFVAALLRACLYNPIYDRQCEGSRTTYLYGLIQLTTIASWFRQQILDALSDPDDDMDLEQLCDFALIYAQTGDATARRVLYEQAGEHASTGETTGAYQLIDLDGVAGFLFIVNRLGEALQSGHEPWDDASLLTHLESTNPKITLDQLRTSALPKYPFVLPYLEHIVALRAQPRATPRPQIIGQPYSSVKHAMEQANGRFSFPLLRRWGAAADDAELQQAARDLLQESEPARLAAYLAIFGKRPFPFGIEPLLPLVWSNHDRIARWSIQALSQFRQPAVRELGFTLIQAQHHVSDALNVFIQNYEQGDDRFLAGLLTQTEDKMALHNLGFGLNDVFAAHPRPEAEDIFLDLYERGPCSLCRERFVERLIEIDRIPLWMEQETRYDANPDVYQAISEYMQAHTQSKETLDDSRAG
jgi:hypothetical protein